VPRTTTIARRRRADYNGALDHDRIPEAGVNSGPIDYRSRDNLPAERNKQPIATVLSGVLPSRGLVLEIASGTGQHAEHFARAWPALAWQPSEAEPRSRALLAARVAAVGLPNLRPPLAFDVHEERVPLEGADAVVCINMIHIAPWSACAALMRHAAALLAAGAPLVLYGPFMRDGAHTAPSNAAFDASLRGRNPDWGVRDLGAVDALARERGFEMADTVAMPANNLTIVWRRVS
jgi:SAM-dependent methyltransferase